MSYDLPESPVPPTQRHPKRKQFISPTDVVAKTATIPTPAIRAEPLRDQSHIPGRIQQEGGEHSGNLAAIPKRSLLHIETSPDDRIRALNEVETSPSMARVVSPSPIMPNGMPTLPPVQNGLRPPTFSTIPMTPTAILAVRSDEERQQRRIHTWKPGTLGFDELPNSSTSSFMKEDTFQMMVLRGIAERQGQPQPVMQSEISGAAGGAAVVGVGNMAGTLLKYGSNFIIQRGFGPAVFGIYSLGLSLVTLISSIFSLGLDNSMLRYISIYRGRKEPGSLRGLVVFCTAIAGITGILGAVLMILFAPALAALRHTPKDAFLLVPTFAMMAPMIPLLCMQVVWFGGLQGFKAFKARVLAQRLIPSISLIILLLVVLLFFHHLKGVVIATLMSTMIGTLVSLYYLFRLVSGFSKQNPEHYQVREWLSFATPNLLTTITDTVLDSTDTLLLAIFSISSVAIGLYAAAIKYSNFISLPLISLNTMFAPIIAELHSKGEHQKLEAMFKIVTKWTILLSLPIFGVTTLFSPSILAISGSGFVAAWPLLIAFSVGAMINAGTGCVGYMLLMTGHQRLSFLNSLSGIVVNLILGILLTPRFGAMGTAISTGLAVSVLNVARLLQVRILLKIQPYSLALLKPLVAGFISAAIVGVPLYYLYHLHMPLIPCLGLVPLFLTIYFGLIALFRLGPEDQIVVDKLRNKFLRNKKNA